MKLKFRLLLITFFTLIYSNVFSQDISAPASWVKAESINNIPSVSSDNVNEGYYYVLADNQYNTIEKSNYFHYATCAVSETGIRSVAQIEINYDPSYEKIQLHFIRIHRGNDVIDRTRNSELKELKEESERNKGILRDDRTLYANLSDIRKGDIVEYAYTKSGYNQIYNDYFSIELGMGYTSPVGRITQRVIVSNDEKLSIKYENCKLQPEILKTGYLTYFWMVNNPALVKLEDDTPGWFDPYPTVCISNCKNWAEVKNWCKSVFQVGEYDETGLIKIADSVKANHLGRENQINSIISFVQNQIRYSGNMNGIYSHHPHSPDFVLKNMYGDCKDKSLFLRELLEKINVTSYPVLLNTRKKNSIKDANPSVNEFDHCILAIKDGDALYFVDPTIAFQHGSFRKRSLPNYGTVFILDSTDTYFTDLVPDTISKTFITEIFKVINDTGDADLYVETKYTGLNADDFRYSYRNNSLANLQEGYRSFYLKYSDEIEVIDTVQVDDFYVENELIVKENYLLKRFWAKSDSASKIIEQKLLPYVLNSKIMYVKDKVRRQPLYLDFPVNIEQKILVTIPKGWNIENNVINEDNDFFHYSYSTSTYDNTLTLAYVYRTKTDNVPPGKYALYKEKSDFVNENIVMNVSKCSDADEIFGFNWLLVATSLVSIIVSMLICLKLYKTSIPSTHEKKYNSLGGWLLLIGLGICITPIALSREVFTSYRDEINIDYYFYFFNTLSNYYEPLRGYYLILTNFGNMFFIISSLFLILLFIKKISSFRMYFIYFRLLNLLFVVIDLLLIYAFTDNNLSHEEKVLVNSQVASIAQMTLQCMIWVPYIWYSERSKHTFVN